MWDIFSRPFQVDAGPVRPTSPLARERCAASFCTFCGISLSWPFCGTWAEIQPTFPRHILRSLSGVWIPSGPPV